MKGWRRRSQRTHARTMSDSQRSTARPATTDTAIAGPFLTSRVIPVRPQTSPVGKQIMISNPPRVPMGFPHPGLRTMSNATVTRAAARNLAPLLPQCASTVRVPPFGGRIAARAGVGPVVSSLWPSRLLPARSWVPVAYWRRGVGAVAVAEVPGVGHRASGPLWGVVPVLSVAGLVRVHDPLGTRGGPAGNVYERDSAGTWVLGVDSMLGLRL